MSDADRRLDVLFRRVYELARSRWILGREVRRREFGKLLEAIEVYADLRHLQLLLNLALVGRDEFRRLAARAARRLRDRVPTEKLRRVDAWLRAYTWTEPNRHWRKLRPRDLDLLRDSEGGDDLLEFAMGHPNGHVRQRATELAPPGGRVIPMLLLRVADWVEPVRREAIAALRRRISPVCARRPPNGWRRRRSEIRPPA